MTELRFNAGVVIPCAPNRMENIKLCTQHIVAGNIVPNEIVFVLDGWAISQEDENEIRGYDEFNLTNMTFLHTEKHVVGNGTLQPKNHGAAYLDKNTECTHVWFIDSDIIVEPETLFEYLLASQQDGEEPRILIGPYEWLPGSHRGLAPKLHNDPRGQFFLDYDPSYTSVGEINFALANFGGNVVYPIEAFKRVGGFWDDLSAGRVEDGEMGLRCAAMGVPMAAVPKARAYHLSHPINHEWIYKTNAEEVPKLNARHPWVEQEGVIVVEKDGKRFDWINPETGESVNTNEIWNYKRRIASV